MIELVGEIGINHSGDLAIAKKLIDVASTAGLQYVKFQKRNIDLVYTQEELNSPRESPWGTTFRDQKEGLEFDFDQYMDIAIHCGKRDISWFASVWDIDSLEFMESFEVPFIKIPSALITNKFLLEAARDFPKQVILSTGMSTFEMVDQSVDILGRDNIYCIMHCTSTYPSAPDEQNLRCILSLKDKYPWARIGFSNHSPGLPFMLAGMALGAELVEFHMTLDRASYGSDQAASIEPEGTYRIAKWARGMDDALGDGIKQIYPSEIPIMKKLRR